MDVTLRGDVPSGYRALENQDSVASSWMQAMRVVHASALVILAICSPLVAATNSATFTNVSDLSISNHPMQFRRQFAKGEITNYPQVLVGGTPVTTQANVQTRWTDGSVKHAIITFILAGPIANNGTSTFTFQNQTGCNCG